MKNILLFTLISIVVGFAACSPIDTKDLLPEKTSEAQINVTVTPIDGSNKIILKNNSLEIGGTWDYKFGFTAKQVDTVIVPVVGTYNVTFYATTAGGIVQKEIPVTIDKMTYSVPGYSELTGNGAGKTWVFNKIDCGNGNFGKYCHMGPKDPAKYSKIWWDPGCAEGDDWYEDENAAIRFEIDGANLVCKFIPETGAEIVGSFMLDMAAMKLTIKDTHIQDYAHENTKPDVAASGIYDISVLEDGSLVLFQLHNAGWFWKYKPL